MTRFREEKIVFMADIEAMYYQVLVPDDQQTFLKFLWWIRSKYVLRRTAIDNKEVYGRDAATTLLRNFYVDDLLKSMKDVQSARQLVQNVIKICMSV